MTDLRLAALGVALSLLAGCARQVAPAGGPVDVVPPILVSSAPDSGAVHVPPQGPFRLRFTEWVDPSTAKSAISLAPVGLKAPTIAVNGAEVLVTPKEPLDSPATYVLRIQPGLADWHKAATKVVQEIPFSTGDRIDSGRILVRLWSASDTAPPVSVRARLGAWPLDSLSRSKLSRLLRRKDSLAWLAQPPLPQREKPWRWTWADSAGLADLRFLPPGRWRVVAWDDKDKDNFWRPGQEPVAWLGDIEGKGQAWADSFVARLAVSDTGTPVVDTAVDTLRARDSLALDSVARLWDRLPDDSIGWAVLAGDSLPRSWKAQDVHLRLWPVGRRARPRLSPPSNASLRLPPGKWTGEAWVGARDAVRPRPSDWISGQRADPWCPVVPFEIDRQDSLRVRLDCAVRRPVADTGKAAK